MINTYVQINVTLIVACLLVFILSYFRDTIRQKQLLRISYVLLTFAIFLPVLFFVYPDTVEMRPAARVWTGSSVVGENGVKSKETLRIEANDEIVEVSIDPLAKALLFLFLTMFLFRLSLLSKDGIALFGWVRRSNSIKLIGRVRILGSESVRIPFAFRGFYYFNVVIPIELIHSPSYRVIVKHELQHHRQGDTLVIYFIEALKILFPMNPAPLFLGRLISEGQEFACDEAMVDLKNISPRAYGGCLWEVAASALNHRVLAGTAGMAMSSGALLKRRVHMILNKKDRKSIGLSLTLLSLVLMVTAAFASQDVIREERISMAQATALAKKARRDSHFPIVVNESVLEWLNYFLGTPKGRLRIKAALKRMPRYERLIYETLSKYNLPKELIAVALIESGFNNVGPEVNPVRAAGVWQFMAQTARNHGLQVDNVIDERLDVPLATDAAARYLGALFLRFKANWGLATSSYYHGEHKVQRAINKTGIRNVWELIEQGELQDYSSRVMAAVLILKNPHLI